MGKKNIMQFLLSGVAGAILVAIVSFAMGWVVTGGRAHQIAKETSEQAVKDHLVPTCLYQFRSQADSASKLETLRGMGEWKREGFVADQGWATMPGSDAPAVGVARECAARLSKIPS
jgi:hypothetical protein